MQATGLVLIVGATGQLGSAVVRRLAHRGEAVRALVRESSHHRHLQPLGIELSYGDLRRPDTLDTACRGVGAVVLTATALVPRERGDSLATVDRAGYAALFAAARRAGVGRVVMVSPLPTPEDARVPWARMRRRSEELLRESGLEYSIIHADLPMGLVFGLMGGLWPAAPEAPTRTRPHPFLRRMSEAATRASQAGRVLIPGDGSTRHSFLAIDDLAELSVRVLRDASATNATLRAGGPETLSFEEVARLFEELRGEPLERRRISPGLLRARALLLRAVSPSAANLLLAVAAAGSCSTEVPMRELAARYELRLTRPAEFLRGQVSNPPARSDAPAQRGGLRAVG